MASESPRQRGELPLRVKCPQCGKRTPYEGNPWRPFCSERCQLIDRAAWAEDKYAIASEELPGTEEGEE